MSKLPQESDSPQKADCPSAPCSPNWKAIADDLAAALERLDAIYRSEQDPEAPMVRPEWLRYPWQRYHRALADSANSKIANGYAT